MVKDDRLKTICTRAQLRTGDLISRRAKHPVTGHEIGHAQSRHQDFGVPLIDENGSPYGQTAKFPPHIKAGDITGIEHFAVNQFQRYRHGKPSAILDVIPLDKAMKVIVRLDKFGVERVGAVFENNVICTVYPVQKKKTIAV